MFSNSDPSIKEWLHTYPKYLLGKGEKERDKYIMIDYEETRKKITLKELYEEIKILEQSSELTKYDKWTEDDIKDLLYQKLSILENLPQPTMWDYIRFTTVVKQILDDLCKDYDKITQCCTLKFLLLESIYHLSLIINIQLN